MAKKFIDVMDTTFRDGFQSVFGARVAMADFLPAVSAAKEDGITQPRRKYRDARYGQPRASRSAREAL